MTFLTYAQNFEDVLLWRALGHIKNGFYIDVGANDPVEHSVTKAFYDAGWWGINIEPMPSYQAVFAEQRPRDINLNLAAGDADGEIVLFEVPAMNGWASTDRDVAAMHQADGYEVEEHVVPLRPLHAICAEHARGDIHFMKIDVEGYEETVLRGMDFARWRPWVLVIEATLPGSRLSNHAAWETLVTAHDYRFAYFDGLNRYYVAAEHADLGAALTVQANVFDGFISRHLNDAWVQLGRDSERILQAEEGLRVARIHHEEQEAQIAALRLQHEHTVAISLQAIGQISASEQRWLDSQEQLRVVQEQAAAEQQQQRAQFDAAQQQYQLDLAATLQQHQLDLTATQEQHQLDLAAAQEQRQLDLAAAQHQHEHDFITAQARYQEDFAAAQAQYQLHAQWSQQLEQQLAAVYASSSWRLTRPWRGLGKLVRAVAPSRAKVLARRALRHLLLRMTGSERLRRLILPHLARVPALDRKVTVMVSQLKQRPAEPDAADALGQVRQQIAAPHLQDVSAATRQVLRDLAASPPPSNPV